MTYPGKRHTIIAGELNGEPLVGQFMDSWYDYYWLNLWEVLWRIRYSDVEYCVVSNNPKFSLEAARRLAVCAHEGKLRVLTINEIPGIAANGGK